MADEYWPRLIKALRAREGMTQSELGERLGVDQSAVSRWERAVDAPNLSLRRALRDLYKRNFASKQDQALRRRVQAAFLPSTLVGRGAVFLEINEVCAREARLSRHALQGRSIYGAFGAKTDEVTQQWERGGIFDGDVMMSMSVNRLDLGKGNRIFIRTLDTPYVASDGEIWCLTELKRISRAQYETLYREWGADTVSFPFDEMC
ncbi:MAG: helix-turn-helix transcriptional regulator [Hyphomonadaceae bacterium]|nr:helix-turn-helix transcriptional regulator [Hyphomonadaceae bacterium]GIK49467.1 MAG: hypothetical protein BroJett013_21640 [Alphaproteobacteria bacterium]